VGNKTACEVSMGRSEGKRPLGRLYVDCRIILELVWINRLGDMDWIMLVGS
jgi:hypothetical protein